MRPVKPPNPNPHAPRYKLPAGACDTHLHVYGPFERYPLVAERGYDPDPHSTLDDYLQSPSRSRLGTRRHRHRQRQRHQQSHHPGRARAHERQIQRPRAARPGDQPTHELRELKDGGFTGFRDQSQTAEAGFPSTTPSGWSRALAGFDWHVEFMSQSMAEVIAAVPFLRFPQSPIHLRPCGPRRAAHDRRES